MDSWRIHGRLPPQLGGVTLWLVVIEAVVFVVCHVNHITGGLLRGQPISAARTCLRTWIRRGDIVFAILICILLAPSDESPTFFVGV